MTVNLLLPPYYDSTWLNLFKKNTLMLNQRMLNFLLEKGRKKGIIHRIAPVCNPNHRPVREILVPNSQITFLGISRRKKPSSKLPSWEIKVIPSLKDLELLLSSSAMVTSRDGTDKY